MLFSVVAWERIFGKIRARGSLRSLARWLFLATLVVAPWLYGATTAESIEIINWVLGVTLVLWVASLLVDRRWPLVPRALFMIAGLILLQGWWMVANAHAIYDSTFRSFISVRPILPAATGSADYVLSFAWMQRATALLGVVCLVGDFAQRPVWLVRLWYALAAAGGSIAALGVLQKAGGAKMIFWRPPVWPPMENFFATYFYHSNAGAFLNLVLPPIAGLMLWTWARRGSPWGRAACLTTLLLVALAILSNTSRMAQAIGAAMVLAMAGIVARPARRMLAQTEKRTLGLGIIVVVIAGLAVAQAVRLDQPFRRWQQFSEQLPVSARWTANRIALSGVGDAGLFGFGPGTFRAVFPHYQQHFPELHGKWRFLHDDYLQTVLEWGWLGSAALASLFFGGLIVGIRSYRRADGWSNRQRILLWGMLVALVGVALHSFVDFPLQILSIQLFAASYLGVCWGSGGWRRSEVGGQRSEVGGQGSEVGGQNR